MTNKRIFSLLKWWSIIFLILFLALLLWYILSSHSTPKLFFDAHSIWITPVLAFLPMIIGLLLDLQWKKIESHVSLSIKHKERVSVLKKFSGSAKFRYTQDSIYGTMIDLLKRCKKSTSKKHLYMLLCSPALDSPARIKGNYKDWGNEFSRLLGAICGDTDVTAQVAYLPNEVILGFNPLYGFVETLASYCTDEAISKGRCEVSDRDTFSKQVFEDIYNNTGDIYTLIDTIKDRHKKNNIDIRKILDIPFQIIIWEQDDLAEVVVSFAGKTILEDGNYIEPQGFHSCDVGVVNAFKQIFESYTDDHKRIPLKPMHTRDIIEKTKEAGEHFLQCYHSKTTSDPILSKPLRISADTFSPFYANSSKFTTDALLHVLQKDNKVIEIGSGSGIQVLAALRKLQDLGTSTPVVWAIEPFAIELLEENCNGSDIVIKKWILKKKNGDYKDLHSVKDKNFNVVLYDESKEKEITDSDFNGHKFDIVLGDLPFVSATTSSDENELAYYDYQHNSHRALFKIFSTAKWVNKNAVLITAFSSLGGYDDIAYFTQMIKDEKLVIVQNFCYLEAGYHWLIYCIMRESDFNALNASGEYWRVNRFGIELKEEEDTV